MGAKAGIGIGAAVFVILAGTIILLLFRSRKSEKKYGHKYRSKNQAQLSQEQKHHEQDYLHELSPEQAYGELSEGRRTELATYDAPQELEARSRQGVH